MLSVIFLFIFFTTCGQCFIRISAKTETSLVCAAAVIAIVPWSKEQQSLRPMKSQALFLN